MNDPFIPKYSAPPWSPVVSMFRMTAFTESVVVRIGSGWPDNGHPVRIRTDQVYAREQSSCTALAVQFSKRTRNNVADSRARVIFHDKQFASRGHRVHQTNRNAGLHSPFLLSSNTTKPMDK